MLSNKMKFALKQVIKLLSLLLGVSLVAFLLLSVSPINPLYSNFSQAAFGSMSAEQISNLEHYWGLHTSLFERYTHWLSGFLQGDMGVSLIYRREVSDVIWEKLVNSVFITGFAWLFSGVLGFTLGVFAGVKRNSIFSTIITKSCLVLASIPAFWLGLLFLMWFSVWLNIFPIGFSAPIGLESSEITIWHKIYHAILPSLCLSIVGIPSMALHSKEKTLEIMQSDYVLFAKARGQSLAYIVKNHALRNLILPCITLQFGSMAEILGASILIEQVFSYPGLGQAAVSAGLSADLSLLMAITVITTAIVFLGNLMANLLYTYADPRISWDLK